MQAHVPLIRRLAAMLLGISAGAHGATFVVTNTSDVGFDGVCDANCSLREAIIAANATAAADTINFSIPTPQSGELLLQPSLLPTITQPVTIDGYSQGRNFQVSPNTLSYGSNAKLRIRLDGSNAGVANGLGVCASNVAIRGLSVTGYANKGIAFGRTSADAACPNPVTAGIVAGNFVGLTTNGSTAAGNGTGVFAFKAVVTIGGASPADRNIIASNTGQGVSIVTAESAGSSVVGNLIGTDKSGTLDRGNGNHGVTCGLDLTDCTVGTTDAPNVVAFNASGIIALPTALSSNRWFANHVFSNDGLGLDLGDDGTSDNDADDADTGPNGLQNFPVLASAVRIADGVRVAGTLDISGSFPRTFALALYASTACDPSGNGEGERFLGAVNRGLQNGVNESFSIDLTTSDPLPPGTSITATATDPAGNSSEFSNCLPLDPPPLVVNSTVDPGNGVCDATECTLREAIAAANALPAGSASVINFNIPGVGERLIVPATPLPAITRSLLIDGYSQSGTSVNTLAQSSNAVLSIRLHGRDAGPSTPGLSVCADDVTIRGLSITGFAQQGIGFGTTPTGTFCTALLGGVASGNFIGLQTDGSTASTNQIGISIRGQATVGGESADRNVIAASGAGVFIATSTSSGTRVENNLVGTDKSGALDRGGSVGIAFSSGTTASSALRNVIARNGTGVVVAGGSGIAVVENEVFGNDLLGIDLAGAGVTLNDANDADTGPNGLQNFPVLNLAQRSDAGILVAGSLDVPAGTASADYRIDLYANTACDPTDHGEGERYLGAQTVTLNDVSGESFAFDLGTDPLGPGTLITSTATAPDGSTSEFSACLAATDPPPDFVVNSAADPGTGICDPAECTLREAIAAANTQAGANRILFAIPGTGPFTIAPAIELPAITDALTIDGYSQLGAAPNTSDVGSNAVILIRIDGGGTIGVGLKTCADEVVLRGLSITRFAVAGIALRSNDANNCALDGADVVVAGNFIGLPPDGSSIAGMSSGIVVRGSVARVGGVSAADRNLIALCTQGMTILGGPLLTGTVVLNNVFGTDPSATLARPNAVGVAFDQDAIGVSIGTAGRPNLLRFSATGILVFDFSTGLNLLGNEFLDTQLSPIDLRSSGGSSSGITPNDSDDADSGGNDLQNFPLLSAAVAGASDLTVTGTLDVPAATSNASYTIALYENAACDASGNGEGEIFLGTQTVILSGGAENFSVTLAGTPPALGRVVTSTATAPDGSTSEFSGCVSVTQSPVIFEDGFEG